ncbi:MAG: hypothetical protein E6G51_12670 [Actinobacteria bacterium]|nr:MAG: hypothetical protein E6G51_12670 [Actinomycetota bacterium]
MRRLWIAVACAGLLTMAIGAGPAAAGLDPGFGEGGVVEVKPPLPSPWDAQYVLEMAAARDGSSYALVQRYCREQSRCALAVAVVRYAADGSIDTSFGSDGSFTLPPEAETVSTIAIDSAGRPLIASAGDTGVVVRRLTPEGKLDSGFAVGSISSPACGCHYREASLTPGPRGAVTISLPGSPNGTLFRLKADGTLDQGFGRGGALSLGTRGDGSFGAVAVGRGGALYLSGATCCKNRFPFLLRVSAAGRLDTRFTRAAIRALRQVDMSDEFGARVSAVLVRPRGTIDVLGSTGFSKGFLLRMRPNGQPLRRFADNGLKPLPLLAGSAAIGSDGAIVAVGEGDIRGFGATVFRILRGGRIDKSFGFKTVPRAADDLGFSIVAQTGRRALVLDLGLHECRGACPSTPKLIRYLEDSRRRR